MRAKAVIKNYLTPNQAAELLMITPATVRQWAEKGVLNAFTTPGGHRRFLASEVERFARERGLTLNVGNSGALRVLIVDDDIPLVGYLIKLLEDYPEQVVTESANNGFDAGLKIREFEPDVVLLDLMMPGLDGFDVCRLLKDDPHTKAIRVIAMTGYPSTEYVEKILASGAELCLPKPIDEEVLLNHLGITQQAKI